jgi:hypothetical protein
VLRDQTRIEFGRLEVRFAEPISNLSPGQSDVIAVGQLIPSIAASWLA